MKKLCVALFAALLLMAGCNSNKNTSSTPDNQSSEPKKEKFWTSEKISFLVATLLAIIQIIQGCVSDMQSSQQLDEISTKIEEHWVEEDKQVEKNKEYQERIISLLETITSQLQEESQSSDGESSLSE